MTETTEEEAATAREMRHASVRKVWRWLASGITTAVIGAAAGVYVPKLLDPPDQRSVALNVVNNPATVNTWGTEEFGLVMPKGKTPTGQLPTDCDRVIDWARRNKAVDQEVTRVRLVIQGIADKGVLIEGLRAKILNRSPKPTPAGVGLRCGGAQGEATPRQLEINLDAENRSAKYSTNTPGQLKPFGFTLEKGETEVFDLAATTRGTAEWLIQLDLVVGGKQETVDVQNRGKPFETTAWKSPQIYKLPAGSEDWMLCTNMPHGACKNTR
ncbi:hypothetical protein HCC61_23895 [Streptomyces sp. HNM0575]|uniref:hypothetical protein n=1 Tax=Streptomyces sp. HNM0575 TaxID=2716338 RepID=UPI00145C545C|nr:hypothetical protein [Streptomyces sp. HNM0575]NLU75660.1 hypothetical protein [Streptomyces sp. HNM0575]